MRTAWGGGEGERGGEGWLGLGFGALAIWKARNTRCCSLAPRPGVTACSHDRAMGACVCSGTRPPLPCLPADCRCGSLLSPLSEAAAVTGASFAAAGGALRGPAAPRVVCRLCDGSGRHIERVAMPYVFKYLATELAAMNIKVTLTVR